MSAEMTVDEYMASVGVDMLHPGGMKRADELAEMCKISEDKKVLDVGCGYGRTACYLANKYGCQVVGIDISQTMIEGARKKARKERVERMVHFEVCNAESTHFENESFEAVISEGTTVMLAQKTRALREYVRVARRGGYVGLNELSWRKKPSKELIERAFTDLQGVQPLEYDEWTRLLVDSGLEDIESRTYKYKSTSWDIIGSLGLRALVKVGIGYLTNSKMRKWISRQEALFHDYSDYWGYGLYAGSRRSILAVREQPRRRHFN